MIKGLNLTISLGLLRARMKQSVVAAAGVTFGIAMFITLISFMSGLNEMLDGLIINRTAHVRLFNEVKPADLQPIEKSMEFRNGQHFIRSIQPKDQGKEIHNAVSIIEAIREDGRVIGVAPKLTSPVFFNAGTIEITGAVNGIEVENESKLFAFGDNVVEGDSRDMEIINNSIFIGKGLAEKMMVGIGDMLSVSTPQGETSSLKIVGIFQVGLADFDDSQCYTSIATAQKILGKSAGYITDIQVKLKEIALAPEVAKEYNDLFRVDAIDIQTANAQFETGSGVRSIISYAVGITLLIVAGFGIYNILNMMIYEKMDSIAIMKATGFSGSDVRRIFLNISIIIGVIGGFFGLMLGYILSLIVDNIPFITAALPKIKTFPVFYNPLYYFIGISFALITTFVAGFFPAKKAAAIDPVIIIRGK
jgi:lipoprotein-releasing system permease protein